MNYLPEKFSDASEFQTNVGQIYQEHKQCKLVTLQLVPDINRAILLENNAMYDL